MSLAARSMLGLIWIYQQVWSPHAAGACRHVPSCSNYASEAVRRHGALRGAWLAMRRLARCHPLGSSGYDPVP
jgi:putative membrane protein insertion efficiency factor